MTGSTRSSDGLDVRRRKLLFRSWHRGLREVAPVMGKLADAEIARLIEAVLEFPAWDCLPYDRVSPHPSAVAQRMLALSRLARAKGQSASILLTTVNAALQRVPPRQLVAGQSLSAAPGNVLAMDGVVRWLELNGFTRASTVLDPGEYAVRGGIIDLFAPGMELGVRLDFFGDALESIRSFDPQ